MCSFARDPMAGNVCCPHTVCNGAPLRSVAELPAGTYDCQCVLHLYETFNLATGHTVKLPMDRGEGQQWNKAPGNLFSPVFELTIRAAAPSDSGRGARTVPVLLSEIMPPIAPPALVSASATLPGADLAL